MLFEPFWFSWNYSRVCCTVRYIILTLYVIFRKYVPYTYIHLSIIVPFNLALFHIPVLFGFPTAHVQISRSNAHTHIAVNGYHCTNTNIHTHICIKMCQLLTLPNICLVSCFGWTWKKPLWPQAMSAMKTVTKLFYMYVLYIGMCILVFSCWCICLWRIRLFFVKQKPFIH